MGPGGVVWVKKTEYKISRETVPLKYYIYIYAEQQYIHTSTCNLLSVDSVPSRYFGKHFQMLI